MNSCIYSGRIKHARYQPVTNTFRYNLFMMYLDLSELDEVFKETWLWSVDRLNLAYLRRGDHFGDQSVSIDRAVRKLIHERTGQPSRGPIRMLTHLRYFGHCFNPVTVYYCYNVTGNSLETIVVEIHNTPWGEVYCYVLDNQLLQEQGGQRKYSFKKDFHISPFMQMDIFYTWFFSDPAETLSIQMIDFQDNRKLFEAELYMQRLEIRKKNLASILINYPLMTVKVIVAIYWQAFRLWKKGAPFFSHPKKMSPKEV